jgi:hypothetical protein
MLILIELSSFDSLVHSSLRTLLLGLAFLLFYDAEDKKALLIDGGTLPMLSFSCLVRRHKRDSLYSGKYLFECLFSTQTVGGKLHNSN